MVLTPTYLIGRVEAHDKIIALRDRLAEVEAQRDGLKDVVRRGIELHENGDANTCMCGESMLHYPTDHSPVSMLEYYGDQWAAEARESLAKLEAHDG